MNILVKIMCLMALISLNSNCAQREARGKDKNPAEWAGISTTDTLKFTSGIHSIYQDTRGNYWFGSHGEGVCRFDGKSFKYFTTNEGLSDNHILSIQEDQDGIIWFGTLNGVSSYDGESIKNNTEKKHASSQNIWVYTYQEASQNNWMKTSTDLWFNAGTKEGVYRFDGQKIQYLDFPKPETKNINNVYAVTAISKGANNMLWFGTYAGVWGYNGSDFTIINDETLGYVKDDERVHVRSILEDSKSRLWIGNNGIGVLLKEGDSIINFSEENGKRIPQEQFKVNTLKKEFAKNTGLQSVFAIAEDRHGNIWFGDRDSGAWKYDGQSLSNYSIDKKLSSQMIWDIYEDRNKNLLFAMAYGGVYQFNGNSFDRKF